MKTKPAFDGEIHSVSARKMPDLNSPKREPGWFLGEPDTTNDAPAPAPSGSGVRVKPLDWFERHPRSWEARAVGLVYRVVDRQWWLDFANGPANPCESDDEAKAAAQADYEARILSALASDASPRGEAVAKVVHYDPRLDPDAMKPRRIIDGTARFMSGAALGTALYAHPAPATAGMRGGRFGPYGYLVIPHGLDEEHWRLEDNPEADPEYTSIALFAENDPFAGRPKSAPTAKGDFTSRAYRIICHAAGRNQGDWSSYDHDLLDLAREADAALAPATEGRKG